MIVIKTNENLPKIEETRVRKHFDEVSQKWQFSVVDIIGLCTSTSDPRNYWKVLKNRLKKGQNKLVTDCNQLKLQASDGKSYLTDVAEASTILSILSKIPNSNAEPFRTLLANIGAPMPEVEKLPKSAEPLDEIQEVADFNHPEGESELLVDAYQTQSEIFITAMIAGVELNDINISVSRRKITISGERKKLANTLDIIPENYKEEYLCAELGWMSFSRTLLLPAEVSTDKVEKVMGNGKLVIRLLKVIN